jgi:tetratricopeptide (TPR) repeat protein
MWRAGSPRVALDFFQECAMTRRIVSSTMVILLLCTSSVFALQVSGASPLSNYQLRKDYEQYEKIRAEADVQKRADLFLEFLKDRPINRLLTDADYKDFVFSDYQSAIQAHQQNKDWAKAISLTEALLAALPSNEAIDDAEIPEGVEDFKKGLVELRQKLNNLLLTTYYTSENWPKAAEEAEKLYAAAPSIQSLQLLADIYLKMQNIDKYLEVAQKIIAESPIDQPLGFSTAYQVVKIHLQKNDIPAATELYTKIMDVYGDKLPENLTDAQWNPERAIAYTLMAQPAYTSKDYPKAIELFEKVLKADPSSGDAWYYIGMCKWQTEGQDSALEPFAKSVVLNKNTAARAQQYLEQIYKAKHSDSLDGIDEVLAKAKTDLGI